ncbi:MAG TPA: hypothetical protein VM369_01710 [Candidatus Binatia bacterium]|nr:hypothetical protein [Candidatus Binatia bacterium]
MPKPNYKFEKRQRELAKAQKKEEKRLKKARQAAEDQPGTAGDPSASPSAEPGKDLS